MTKWIDCETCGTNEPKLEAKHFSDTYMTGGRWVVREWDNDVPVKNASGQMACRICGKFYAPREVNGLRSDLRAKYGSQCDGRCLSGKRNCDCKCGGLCHGRGECACGVAV